MDKRFGQMFLWRRSPSGQRISKLQFTAAQKRRPSCVHPIMHATGEYPVPRRQEALILVTLWMDLEMNLKCPDRKIHRDFNNFQGLEWWMQCSVTANGGRVSFGEKGNSMNMQNKHCILSVDDSVI